MPWVCAFYLRGQARGMIFFGAATFSKKKIARRLVSLACSLSRTRSWLKRALCHSSVLQHAVLESGCVSEFQESFRSHVSAGRACSRFPERIFPYIYICKFVFVVSRPKIRAQSVDHSPGGFFSGVCEFSTEDPITWLLQSETQRH